MSKTIGFICGSLREGSINRKLEHALSHHYRDAGFRTRSLGLGDYDLPIYHGDLDEPEGLQRLCDDMLACDGIVVVTPEYNGGLPPVLKNAIDWVSTKGKAPFQEAAWGVAACTPGPLSGVVCMRGLALLLMRLGGRVCSSFVGVGGASEAFNAEGRLATSFAGSLASAQVAEMSELIG